MTWPNPARLLVPMALATALLALPARAAAGRCTALTVGADGGVRARWPELPARVLEAFRGRADIDGCARVALALRRGAIAVTVTLADGRSTSRTVARQQDLLPMVEALLLVPPAPTPEAAALSPPPPTEPPPTELDTTVRVVADAPAAPGLAAPAPPPRRPTAALRLELSLVTSARVGNGETTLGLGVLSFAELHGGLLGFAAGVERYQPVRGGVPAGAIEVAALGGWRFERAARALDVYGGPALLTPWGSQRAVARATPGATGTAVQSEPPQPPDGPMPRARAGVRLDFRADATLRPWMALDGDLGGSRAVTWEGGRVPSWGVGLSVGAMVGTL